MINVDLLRALLGGTDMDLQSARPQVENPGRSRFKFAADRNAGLRDLRSDDEPPSYMRGQEPQDPRTSKFKRGFGRFSGIGHTLDDLSKEDDGASIGYDTHGLPLMALLRLIGSGKLSEQTPPSGSQPDEPGPDQYGQIPWRR